MPQDKIVFKHNNNKNNRGSKSKVGLLPFNLIILLKSKKSVAELIFGQMFKVNSTHVAKYI
jgi:hypothetical protein